MRLLSRDLPGSSLQAATSPSDAPRYGARCVLFLSALAGSHVAMTRHRRRFFPWPLRRRCYALAVLPLSSSRGCGEGRPATPERDLLRFAPRSFFSPPPPPPLAFAFFGYDPRGAPVSPAPSPRHVGVASRLGMRFMGGAAPRSLL